MGKVQLMNSKAFLFSLLVFLPLHGNAVEGAMDTRALEAGARSGDADAQFQLGRAYYRGEGVPRDMAKAVELIRKAAEAGKLEAIESMGFLCTTGEGVPKSEEEAVAWFRKGEKAGSARSKLNLGLLLRQGKTIELSNAESIRLMHAAAEAGLPEAHSYLGQLYFQGDEFLEPDYAKAAIHARKAAETGDPSAQNVMGLINLDGLDVGGAVRNPAAAEQWFRKAAEQGEVKAQANLAHLMGVESPSSTNRVEALMWLVLAKDQDEPTATKTFNEIAPNLAEDLLLQARERASRFPVDRE